MFLSALFFIFFILIAAFVMLSLFVGAVCGGMSEALDQMNEMEATAKVPQLPHHTTPHHTLKP